VTPADRGESRRRILIGVTIDDSLQFHIGLPAALVREGWDVHVVSGPGRRIQALADEPGVSTHVLAMRRGPSPVRDLVALATWIRLLHRVRPHVTLIGTPKAALLGHIAGSLTRVPRRIYNLLGLRVETARGPLRIILTAMERLTASSATEVLAVSRSVQERAVRLRLVGGDRVTVLGGGSSNGVDVDRYRELSSPAARKELAARISLEPGVPVIGFVGRLTRDKGLPELADALRRMHGDGRQVQLLVVGGVDDPSGQAALRELESTGQRVVAVGYQEEPAPFYAVMDVFCLPSLREGLPNVVLESMASGTPVVASDATGNVDLVIDGETGYLVPMRSGEALARALTAAIDDAPRTRRTTARARTFVAERYEQADVQRRILAYLGDAT
jgi:glycosyltransferase involved in cell wall biosynthesis